MGTWTLRVRAILDNQFLLVVVGLVLLAGLGGWVTYNTHYAPGTTTEERPASSWETTGQFAHSATVQEDSSVFSEGQTLTNRSVYFTAVSPELDGTFRFTYDASENGKLAQTASLSLVIRGVDQGEQEQDERVLWQTTEPLNESTAESTPPGETLRVPFSINVNDVSNRTNSIQSELGASPGQTEVFVRASVDFQGTVNGEEVDRTRTYTLPLRTDGNTYSLGGTDPQTDRHETMRTVTVQRTYGPLQTVGGPALLGGSLIVLVGLLTANHLDKLGLSPEERDRLEYQDDRAEFEEWISPMQLPEEAFDRPRAEATSLGALVDFAIDTNNSVIEDPNRVGYYVLHDDYLYSYRPGATHSTEEGQVPVSQNGHSEPIATGCDRPDSVASETDSETADGESGSSNDSSVDDGV